MKAVTKVLKWVRRLGFSGGSYTRVSYGLCEAIQGGSWEDLWGENCLKWVTREGAP